MLDVRFDFEQKWLLSHQTIRTRAFYTALHKRYSECADYIGSCALQYTPEYSRTAEELLNYVGDEDLSQYELETDLIAPPQASPAKRTRAKTLKSLSR